MAGQGLFAATLLSISVAAASMAAVEPTGSFESPGSLGDHWVSISLGNLSGVHDAVWARVEWARRPHPPAETTNVVLIAEGDGSVVTNAVRAPDGSRSQSESILLVFQPAVTTGVQWILNDGTAKTSVVTNCSGQYSSDMACWKAADGVIAFVEDSEGWDGVPVAGTTEEFLEFDLIATAAPGSAPPLVDVIGIFSVGPADDAHYPVHNPARVIIQARASPSDAWTTINRTECTEAPNCTISVPKTTTRYWRVEIDSRHQTPNARSHSWIKEVQFGVSLQEPVPVSEYRLMYAPYTYSGSLTGISLQATFDPIDNTASASWLGANGLTPSALKDGSFTSRLPQVARLISLDASSDFDAFGPMEMVATSQSVASLLKLHPNPVLFFPEQRENLVRMAEAIPQRWADVGPTSIITGSAAPGETFAFQIGVWAARSAAIFTAEDVSWSDLSASGTSASIPASAIECHNIRGIDYRGRPFAQNTTVPAGSVGALWFSVAVPQTGPTVGATVTGTITVQGATFKVTLDVSQGPPVTNNGADDVWRMSRLRWLDSTLGMDRNITAGYSPVTVGCSAANSCVAVLSQNRTITVGPSRSAQYVAAISVLDAVSVGSVGVLASPLQFGVTGVRWSVISTELTQHDNMSATIMTTAESDDGALAVNCSTAVNFDGFVDITVALSTRRARSLVLSNVTLSLQVSQAASTYFMGLGLPGRDRAANYPQGTSWLWAQNRGGQNQLWTGSVKAGMRLKFKGDEFDWESPLHHQDAPPASWGGDNQTGGVFVRPAGADAEAGSLTIVAYTGSLTVPPGGISFRFDALVTPVKELQTARHFRRDRYYQYGYNGLADCDEIAAMGVKVLNLHQGVLLNPYINYPFEPTAMARQANFSKTCKSLGVQKTKIYFTTRELSNRCYEMPALRTLETPTDAFFDNDTGGGAPWLQLHLQTGYHRRWSTHLSDGELDAAIADTSLSRWVNYYVQGLQWLSEDHTNTSRIDGLYLDELSFDRTTMQRMRKAVDARRSGSLFDLHSCNKQHCGNPCPNSCSALIYMAHFPYLDSLWFGEGFSSDYPPDQWLVEMSGIPYGMHAEQLSSPNLWRGMVFAEGARPAPYLWLAWDAMGLTAEGVQLVGWWEPGCPVTVKGDAGVIASVYTRPGKGGGCVVAIASWSASTNASISLEIDWTALGLTAGTATIRAPAITNFQPNATFDAQDPRLTVSAAKGWLLDIAAATSV